MNRTHARWAALAVASMALVGCATGAPQREGARNVSLTSAQSTKGGQSITQAELQDSLQRFTAVFTDRMAQTMNDVAAASSPEVSDAALRQALVYASSALEIATGPLPEVNLLDMIVFVRLCREVYEAHWMPELYGDRGRVVLDVLRASEEELWAIAARVISPEQRTKLEALVDRWRREHPEQLRVEGVRLMDFAVQAGRVERARAEETGGLMATVRAGTQVADQAVLLAQRGLFLANRMPFLIRLQARLGSREIVSDALARVGSPSQLLAEVGGLEPLVRRLPGVAAQAAKAAEEARLLVGDVRPLVPSAEGADRIDATISRTNELVINTRGMLEQARALTASAPPADVVTNAKRGVDDTIKKAVAYLALLGALWSLVWWGGYYVVKRRLLRHA